MFEGKKILITGGTGSLGQALTKFLLKSDVDTVRIFSRNENKQVMMESALDDDRLRFFVGDVRDLSRLTRAMEDVDIVFHTAALKHVPVIEYNPFESIKTNVIGSQNVIDACLHENVESAVCIGTDKAVSPLNTYGATKLLMEKLFVSATNYLNKQKHKTKFVAVRYGNVLGSSGSIVPKFLQQVNEGKKITITDPEMTRFNITMDQALDLIVRALTKGTGGEVFVPKLKAYKVGDMKDAIIDLTNSSNQFESIPVRPGEKSHEMLINTDEIKYTFENESDYILLQHQKIDQNILESKNLLKCNLTSQYSSDKVELFSKDDLKTIISNEKLV